MEGLEVYIDDECLFTTDEHLVGYSSVDPRVNRYLLGLGDRVLGEKREGTPATIHAIHLDIGIVLVEIATQGLRDDTCPRILIEHRLL